MPDLSVSSLLLDGVKFLTGTAVGAIIVKRVQGKARLVSHWGSVSAFTIRNANQPPVTIHTHEIVIRNAGSKPANDVRVTHNFLPEHFNINPALPYSVQELPGTQRDIVIPKLVPKQQIVISYLYYPPVTYAQINAGVRCDEGFATPVEMAISEKPARWAIAVGWLGFALGCLTALYLAWRGLRLLGG